MKMRVKIIQLKKIMNIVINLKLIRRLNKFSSNLNLFGKKRVSIKNYIFLNTINYIRE